MVFLIFVATFVTLACLVVPLATLAAFAAIERSDQAPSVPARESAAAVASAPPSPADALRRGAAGGGSKEAALAQGDVWTKPSALARLRRDRDASLRAGGDGPRPPSRGARETVVT